MFDKKNNKDNNSSGDNKFDGFVESIEEEIRSENWKVIWDKYGKLITYASCVLIAAVGVYGMWQKQDLSEKEAISSRYTIVQSSIMSGNLDSALSEIKQLANVSKKDYATLARFEYASILRAKKDKNALSEYKNIFEDKKVNKILKDLAYIFYVNSSIDLMSLKEIDSVLNEFIKELSVNYIGKTWDLLAKETLAFCYMKLGNNKLAKDILENLAKTSGVPENMAERARGLILSINK